MTIAKKHQNHNPRNLINIVSEKILLLLSEEPELFTIGENGVHEQTISHRLALLFEGIFEEYNVDCEYNKHGDLAKTLDSSRAQHCKCLKCKNKHKKVRPDIIVHKRHTEDNLICIEIKKCENCQYDIYKVRQMTRQYNYLLGVFVNFNNGRNPKIQYFHNGEIL